MVGKGEIFIEQDTKELIGAGRWIRMIGVDAFKYRDFVGGQSYLSDTC